MKIIGNFFSVNKKISYKRKKKERYLRSKIDETWYLLDVGALERGRSQEWPLISSAGQVGKLLSKLQDSGRGAGLRKKIMTSVFGHADFKEPVQMRSSLEFWEEDLNLNGGLEIQSEMQYN